MKLLLDTQALLWWLTDDGRLGTQARAVIADPTHDVMVSSASLWEIVVKVRIGKLEADVAMIVRTMAQQGFTRLDILPDHLASLTTLPLYADHRDPFDHLLLAQAIAEQARFVSDDRNAIRYPVDLIRCSDRPG